jgi:hypothetical protein
MIIILDAINYKKDTDTDDTDDTDTDTGYIKALSDSNLTRCVF